MRNIPQIRSRVFNKPLMVTPDFLHEMADFLNSVGPALSMPDPASIAAAFPSNVSALTETNYSARRDPEDRVKQDGGIAMIQVMGGLAQRQGFDMRACEAIQGYDSIRADIAAAVADKSVNGIMLNIDSPGGEVAGNFALVDFINAASAVKPIWGMASEHAYSAAYSIASATNKFILPSSGGAGSIGVVMAHVSHEKALAEAGIEVTYIYAGDHKVDGNPANDLTNEVRADLQAKVNGHYKAFTTLVANNRGIPVQSVIETQARTFAAGEAVERGLADEVLSADDTLTFFREHLASYRSTSTGVSMGTKSGTTAGATADVFDEDVSAGFTQLDIDAARAEGVVEGTTAEHERIFGIVNCPEAVGRESIALGLAEDGLAPAQAAKSLARFPIVAAVAASVEDQTDVLGAAMAASGAAESGVTAVLSASENTPMTPDDQANEALELLEMATYGNQRMKVVGGSNGN